MLQNMKKRLDDPSQASMLLSVDILVNLLLSFRDLQVSFSCYDLHNRYLTLFNWEGFLLHYSICVLSTAMSSGEVASYLPRTVSTGSN